MKNKIKIMVSVIFAMATMPDAMAAEAPSSSVRLTLVHHSKMVSQFNAIESDSLRISMNDRFNGFIEGKVCDACEVVKVKITPKAKAFANNIEVPLKNAKSRIGRYATVIYDVDTKNVTEIRW